MPDDACQTAREALRHQLSRLENVLHKLTDGPAWPSDPLAQYDIAFIMEQVRIIEASLDEITRVVALVKDSSA